MHTESRETGLSIQASDRELIDSETLDLVRDIDGRVAAREVLQTIGRLMETLNTERQVVLASEERRRSAEIDNARLRAELEGERELREHVEGELEKLRAIVDQRQERARAELDALWAREEQREPARAGADAGSASASEPAPASHPDSALGQVLLDVFERKLSEARSDEHGGSGAAGSGAPAAAAVWRNDPPAPPAPDHAAETGATPPGREGGWRLGRRRRRARAGSA